MPLDLEAIRARSKALDRIEYRRTSLSVYEDRSALLAAYDALAAAARKVTCHTCQDIARGYRTEWVCPDCADLVRILGGER